MLGDCTRVLLLYAIYHDVRLSFMSLVVQRYHEGLL
jgi:hypothetical protein